MKPLHELSMPVNVPTIVVEATQIAEMSPALHPVLPSDQDLELPIPAVSIASQRDRYPLVVQVFCSSFITIFLAELGDKTQVTTLLMSAESQSPWIVFAGAGSALILTSLLGVLLGQWLATRLAPRTLEVAAGISLLMVSALLVWDIIQS